MRLTKCAFYFIFLDVTGSTNIPIESASCSRVMPVAASSGATGTLLCITVASGRISLISGICKNSSSGRNHLAGPPFVGAPRGGRVGACSLVPAPSPAPPQPQGQEGQRCERMRPLQRKRRPGKTTGSDHGVQADSSGHCRVREGRAERIIGSESSPVCPSQCGRELCHTAGFSPSWSVDPPCGCGSSFFQIRVQAISSVSSTKHQRSVAGPE